MARRRLLAGALASTALLICSTSASAATPRRSVDVTISGLTCSTFIKGDPSTTEPVPGTSSVRVRFTVPTVLSTRQDIDLRDLRVELTTNAGAALAARGGFTSLLPTTQAAVHWSQLPAGVEYSHTDYGRTPQAIGGGITTNTFSSPQVGTTAGGYNGWRATSPLVAGVAVSSFTRFAVYGSMTPGLDGAASTPGSLTCVVPAGVPSEVVSLPVRDDLPVITQVSPNETYVLFPTWVTLRGRNFRNVSAIDLGPGGRTSAFVVNSSTQIQVLVAPVAWGPHPIRIVTRAFTSDPGYLFAEAWY